MARPQSPDYDKRRAAIVAAAATLYARNGFAGASVADLAKACSTSKSLIYHYFPSKEDILYDVMASHLELLVEAAEAALQQQGPEARLRALASSFMQLYSGAADRHKVLLNELDNLPPERRAEVISAQRRIVSAVEEMLRDGGGGARAKPLAMLFFGMINWTHTWLRPGGSLGPEDVAALAVDTLLYGMAPSAPQAS